MEQVPEQVDSNKNLVCHKDRIQEMNEGKNNPDNNLNDKEDMTKENSADNGMITIENQFKHDEIEAKKIMDKPSPTEDNKRVVVPKYDRIKTSAKPLTSEHFPAGQENENMSECRLEELGKTITPPAAQSASCDNEEISKFPAEEEKSFLKNVEKENNMKQDFDKTPELIKVTETTIEEPQKRNEFTPSSGCSLVQPMASTNNSSPKREQSDTKNVLRAEDKTWMVTEHKAVSESATSYPNDKKDGSTMYTKDQTQENESVRVEPCDKETETEKDISLSKQLQNKDETLPISVDRSEAKDKSDNSSSSDLWICQEKIPRQSSHKRQRSRGRESYEGENQETNAKKVTKTNFEEDKSLQEKGHGFDISDKRQTKDSSDTVNSSVVATATSAHAERTSKATEVPSTNAPETLQGASASIMDPEKVSKLPRRFSDGHSVQEISVENESAQTQGEKTAKVKRHRSFAGFNKGFHRLFGRKDKQKDKETTKHNGETEEEDIEEKKTKTKKWKKWRSVKKEKKTKTK